MKPPATPPYSDSGASDVCITTSFWANPPISPAAFSPGQPSATSRVPTFQIPAGLTQEAVEAHPQLKRIQTDLLLFTSFCENSSLTWRPSWFDSPAYASTYWTLHNPPHIVTEELPRDDSRGSQVMTRRLRKEGDREPIWMKTQAQWERYCDMYGIPRDFLCEDQVRLMRLGLPRGEDGRLCALQETILTRTAPPSWPLYPEPLATGDYVLLENTSLPRKFRSVNPQLYESDEYIVVGQDGALRVEELTEDQVVGRRGGGRWSHLPWTKEQELSCQPVKLKLRFWNSAMIAGC